MNAYFEISGDLFVVFDRTGAQFGVYARASDAVNACDALNRQLSGYEPVPHTSIATKRATIGCAALIAGLLIAGCVRGCGSEFPGSGGENTVAARLCESRLATTAPKPKPGILCPSELLQATPTGVTDANLSSGVESGHAAGNERRATPTQSKAAGNLRPLSYSRVSVRPAQTFIDRLALIESGGNPNAVGDRGLARGLHQMHLAAWSDASAARRKRGLPVWPYSFATNPIVSRIMAAEYIEICRASIAASGSTVSPQTLLMCWQCGPHAFRRRGFSLARIPRSTRHAIRKLSV